MSNAEYGSVVAKLSLFAMRTLCDSPVTDPIDLEILRRRSKHPLSRREQRAAGRSTRSRNLEVWNATESMSIPVDEFDEWVREYLLPGVGWAVTLSQSRDYLAHVEFYGPPSPDSSVFSFHVRT